jgi:hypothetical protein
MVRSLAVCRQGLCDWYDFLMKTYQHYNIVSADQVYNGDETAIASQDNVPYVDSAIARVARIFGNVPIFSFGLLQDSYVKR